MQTSFRGDFRLLILVGILVVVSIIMITSIGVPKSIELSAPHVLYPSCDDITVDCYLLLKKHLVRMAIGLLGFFIASRIPYKFWRDMAVPFFGVIFLLLLAVLFLGSTHNTFARSWLQFFDTSFQPAEMAKLAMVFYLAYWCEKKQKEIDTLHGGFIPFVTVLFFMLLPILLQPDVGSAFVMLGIAFGIFYVSGANVKHLFVSFFIGLFLASIVVLSVPHIKNRFLAFLKPAAECREDYCWQSEQANIAVGSGGFFGRGLAQGVQKSYWLPQATDDFIFAASSEELGFLRTLLIVLLYVMIGYRGSQIARQASTVFGSLVATGITTWILFQAFLNIAVNIGLFPITGITLPFISYGGSSMLSLLISVGVLYNISKNTDHANSFHRRRDSGTHLAQYRRS